MLALAIDTSGDVSSIALATEKQLVAELNFRHKMDLLQRLMPNVDRLFADSKRTKDEIDGVVISLGPGSFTGLRIGMAAAKSIAHVMGEPIVGISTMEALAHGASPAAPKSVITLIHSRPGQAYCALFKFDGKDLVRGAEDGLSPVAEIIERARLEDQVVFCGDSAERNREAFEAEFGPGAVLDEWFNHPKGFVIARLGIERLIRGESDDVMTIAPTYVQRPTPIVRLEQGSFESDADEAGRSA